MYTALIRTLYLANNVARVLWWFFFSAVPLAESQCQDQRSGRHGPPPEDIGGFHCGQSQKEVYGGHHICILLSSKKQPKNMIEDSRKQESMRNASFKFSDGFEIKINTTLFLHLNHHHCLFYQILGEEKNSLFKPMQYDFSKLSLPWFFVMSKSYMYNVPPYQWPWFCFMLFLELIVSLDSV